MTTEDTFYMNCPPITAPETLEVTAVPTAVVSFEDFPMADMTTAFDTTFAALFPAMVQAGVNPIGAPFSLHHRLPTDTVTFELGIPIDAPLKEEITADNGLVVGPSTLPAGKLARVSYLGEYHGLGPAWNTFLQGLGESGEQLAFPFWEVYVTDPSQAIEPAVMRTDLYTLLG